MCPAWGKQPKPPQTGFGVGTGGSVPPRGELSKVSQTHGADSTKKKNRITHGICTSLCPALGSLVLFFQEEQGKKDAFSRSPSGAAPARQPSASSRASTTDFRLEKISLGPHWRFRFFGCVPPGFAFSPFPFSC